MKFDIFDRATKQILGVTWNFALAVKAMQEARLAGVDADIRKVITA